MLVIPKEQCSQAKANGDEDGVMDVQYITKQQNGELRKKMVFKKR